jgi:hypothetical protein
MGAVGAVAGGALGALLVFVLTRMGGIPTRLDWITILAAMVLTTAFGMGAAYWPAQRAAAIQPADASIGGNSMTSAVKSPMKEGRSFSWKTYLVDAACALIVVGRGLYLLRTVEFQGFWGGVRLVLLDPVWVIVIVGVSAIQAFMSRRA